MLKKLGLGQLKVIGRPDLTLKLLVNAAQARPLPLARKAGPEGGPRWKRNESYHHLPILVHITPLFERCLQCPHFTGRSMHLLALLRHTAPLFQNKTELDRPCSCSSAVRGQGAGAGAGVLLAPESHRRSNYRPQAQGHGTTEPNPAAQSKALTRLERAAGAARSKSWACGSGAEGLTPRKAPEAEAAATRPTSPNMAEPGWETEHCSSLASNCQQLEAGQTLCSRHDHWVIFLLITRRCSYRPLVSHLLNHWPKFVLI